MSKDSKKKSDSTFFRALFYMLTIACFVKAYIKWEQGSSIGKNYLFQPFGDTFGMYILFGILCLVLAINSKNLKYQK